MTSFPFQPAEINENSLYKRARDWADPHSAQFRESLYELWKQYEPFAPRNFLKNLQIDFYQRWWEMYLGVGLLNLGCTITTSKRDEGPDFRIEAGSQHIFIEAIAPEVGINDDKVPEPVINGCAVFPKQKCLFRLTRALNEKCSVFRKYIQKSVIHHDSCRVIALSAADLNQFGSLMDGFYDNAPAVMGVLCGAGSLALSKSSKPNRFFKQQTYIHTSSGNPVDSHLFASEQFEIISGVMYSSVDPFNAPSNPVTSLILIENPNARNPLPSSFFDGLECWYRESGDNLNADWAKRKR